VSGRPPFDIGVFVTPLERVVRLDVKTTSHTFSGWFTPDGARALALLLQGAADFADGKQTADAFAFLAGAPTSRGVCS
jgi:hypothetical protein